MAELQAQEEAVPAHASVESGIKAFGKYDYNVDVRDPGLAKYLSLKPLELPHTFARFANKQFGKSKANIVERLANKLMRGGTGEKLSGRVIRTHGKLQGKKLKTLKIIEEAFVEVQKRTNQNPIQVLVRAVENSAPREDVTRVRFGGVSYQVAVDVSPQRRIDLALRNIALAAIMSSFDNRVTLGQALSNEIALAGSEDQSSYSIKRKNDTERMAKSAR
ncbi:MAG: 30S ribosomal protein S7 [Candidatus Micrarchaeia archaeon]